MKRINHLKIQSHGQKLDFDAAISSLRNMFMIIKNHIQEYIKVTNIHQKDAMDLQTLFILVSDLGVQSNKISGEVTDAKNLECLQRYLNNATTTLVTILYSI